MMWTEPRSPNRVSVVDVASSEEVLAGLDDIGMAPSAPLLGTTPVQASADAVWGAIAPAGNLKTIHPFCDSTEVVRWPGLESRDFIRYYSGVHYQRDVTAWDEGRGYDLAVGPPDSRKIALAQWRIEPGSGDLCTFSIECVGFVRTDGDEEARAAYEAEVLRGALLPYLDAVVRGVAHVAETGQPVRRNQFGPNPVYSPE